MPRKAAGSTGRANRPSSTFQQNPLGVGQPKVIAPGQRFNAPIHEIAANPRNIREAWEYETLEFEEFAANLAAVGQIQDCVVCAVEVYTEKYDQHADDFADEVRWVLLTGERRFMAAKRNGKDVIPCVRRDEMVEKGDRPFISENRNRKGLDALTLGMLYSRIHDEEGLTFEAVAESLGDGDLTKSGISKRVRLFQDFPEGPARQAIRQGDLGVEPAYLLMTKLREEVAVNSAYELMKQERLTAKRAIARFLGEPDPVSPPQSSSPSSSLTAPAAPSTGTGEKKYEAGLGSEVLPAGLTPPSEAKPTGETPQSGGEAGARVSSTKPVRDRGEPVVPPARASEENQRSELRESAARRALADRMHADTDEFTLRVALELIAVVLDEVLDMAIRLCAEPDDQPRFEGREEVLRHVAQDKEWTVRIAGALVMAGPETEIRRLPVEAWGTRHRFYLLQLGQHGYVLSDEEEEFVRVSSTKLSTPESQE